MERRQQYRKHDDRIDSSTPFKAACLLDNRRPDGHGRPEPASDVWRA
jgi:hypothetical protein